MPELAEVETLKKYLKEKIIGEKLDYYHQQRPNLRYHLACDINNHIIGGRITDVERIAKYVIIHLDNGNCLVVHLGMTGRFTLREREYQLTKHDHICIITSSGAKLIFNDARRFGMIYALSISDLAQAKFLRALGPDPIKEDFRAEYLYKALRARKTSIKTALLDSKILVGVGNIYASESLFRAKIHPSLASNNLSMQQCQLLVESIIETLSEAIEAGGTTLKDFVNGDASPGYFQQKLLVYGRDGQICTSCNGIIEKIKQAGRSSFFCPECQKMPIATI